MRWLFNIGLKFVFFMLLFQMTGFCVFCGVNVKSKCRDKKLEIQNVVDSAILHVVETLGWTEMAVVYDNYTEVDRLLNTLHARNISTELWEFESGSLPSDGLLPTLSSDHIIVLGTDVFVQQTFQRVAKVANDTQKQYKLFDTEWLTVISAQNKYQMEFTAKPFENLAAIAREAGTDGMSLWTMLRSGDRTHLQYVTLLPSKVDVSFSKERVFPNQYQGLGGRTLRVAVVERSYLLFSSVRNGTKVFEGVTIDLLNELSRRLNFSYRLIELEDWDGTGYELEDGQWSGMIGMLMRKEIDLGLTASRLTDSRSAVADPTIPYNVAEARLVYRRPTSSRASDDFQFFLRPFQVGVYFTVAASLVAMTALLVLSELCHRWWFAERQTSPTRRTTVARWIADDVEVLVAALLHNTTGRDSESRAGRVLVCSWLLLGVVLTSVYSSKLTSSLAVTDQVAPFKSMAELVKLDTYTWSVRTENAIESILKESTAPVYKKFYQGMLNFAESDPSFTSPAVEPHKQKVFHSNHVFLEGNEELYEIWRSESCDITSMVVQGFQKNEVFYLQKGSPYTKSISRELGHIVQAGLVTYWKKKWSPNKPGICLEISQQQHHHDIQLTEIQTAFLLAGAGIGLAAVALGTEWCLMAKKFSHLRVNIPSVLRSVFQRKRSRTK